MIPKLRDVGETVNILADEELMTENLIFRGGTINELFNDSELPRVATILNLRTGTDKVFPSVRNIHIPAVDSIENYQTKNGKVINWANRALMAINSPESFPILVHGTAGKDRTGIIIALILSAIGIDRSIIIEEYLQSKGVMWPQKIEIVLNGIGEPSEYIYDNIITKNLRALLIKR